MISRSEILKRYEPSIMSNTDSQQSLDAQCGLVRAIIADPSDHDLRGILADLLEETVKPELQKNAEALAAHLRGDGIAWEYGIAPGTGRVLCWVTEQGGKLASHGVARFAADRVLQARDVPRCAARDHKSRMGDKGARFTANAETRWTWHCPDCLLFLRKRLAALARKEEQERLLGGTWRSIVNAQAPPIIREPRYFITGSVE